MRRGIGVHDVPVAVLEESPERITDTTRIGCPKTCKALPNPALSQEPPSLRLVRRDTVRRRNHLARDGVSAFMSRICVQECDKI